MLFRQSSLLLALIVPTLSAQAAFWSPHLGIDYKYWGVVAGPQYEETFPRLNNAFDAYIGTRINGYFGVDVGYENSINKMKTQVYEGGELIFAQPEILYNSTMIDLRLHSLYGQMSFYWQVVDALELIFSMGAAYIYPDTHIMHLDADLGVWYEYQNASTPFWSGRFGFGVQYNPIPCLGLKASVTFDQVKRLRYIGVDETDLAYQVGPYHSATSYGIGFVYSLSDPRRGSCCN